MEGTRLKLSDKTKLVGGIYPFHIETYHNDKGTSPPRESPHNHIPPWNKTNLNTPNLAQTPSAPIISVKIEPAIETNPFLHLKKTIESSKALYYAFL